MNNYSFIKMVWLKQYEKKLILDINVDSEGFMNNQIKRSLGRSIAVAALGVGLLGQGAWAEDLDPEAIERGKAAAATCVACQQEDGSGMNNEGLDSWQRLTVLHIVCFVTH